MLDKNMKGRRVRLTRCSDPYTRLEPGDEGTIAFVDGMGTVHVNWDSGSSLGLVPGEDSWTVLPLTDDQYDEMRRSRSE
jgi:hypothetical protein